MTWSVVTCIIVHSDWAYSLTIRLSTVLMFTQEEMNKWRTLIGAVPMITMAQSTSNWHNRHTHMDRTHSLTHLHYSKTMLCEAPAQLLLFSACWLFSCFRNPPNSDMECRIFIVHTWSFLCVCIHRGWAHWQRVSTTFFTLENSQ